MDMLKMMPERAKSSLAKVMTALTVVAGAQGVAAVAMPEPEVNVEEHGSFDGYAGSFYHSHCNLLSDLSEVYY